MNKQHLQEQAQTEKRHWARLTYCCNNDCLFCLDKRRGNTQNNTRNYAEGAGIIPFKEIIKNLKQGRKNKIKRVVLSGGDPTLHPELLKIIKSARKMGYSHIQIITNGRMLAYKDFAKSLKEAGLDEITFSLHSHKKDIFEKISGAKGSYSQSLAGLKNALELGFIVSVDIVINKLNYRHLRDILDFYIKFGVSEFDLLWLIPFGSAWKNWKKLSIIEADKNADPEGSRRGGTYPSSRAELATGRSGASKHADKALISALNRRTHRRQISFYCKKYLDKALELSKEPGIFIFTNRLPAEYLEGYENLIQHPIKIKDEIRGMYPIFENYLKNGELMPCQGERCDFCFLRNFCKDLIELKERGYVKSLKNPYCILNNSKSKIQNPKSKINSKFQIPNSKLFKMYHWNPVNFNIFNFADFFIKHRWFVRSSRCKKCRYYKKCRGENILEIRERGFGILKPR